jgi:hypothetical protein
MTTTNESPRRITVPAGAIPPRPVKPLAAVRPDLAIAKLLVKYPPFHRQ